MVVYKTKIQWTAGAAAAAADAMVGDIDKGNRYKPNETVSIRQMLTQKPQPILPTMRGTE
jgi:hypothetical protein